MPGTVRAMKVLFVGDTHANPIWWHEVVEPLAERIDADAIIQLGDFGYWPSVDGEFFAQMVRECAVPVYFCDGNHEHHDVLARDVAAARDRHRIVDPTAAVPLGGALRFLPRGARLRLGSVSFCAVGGAVSIDRASRTPGRDWFAEERVSDDDVALAAAGGHADVMLCHDAPGGWAIPNLPAPAEMSMRAQLELPASGEHRMRLRAAFEAISPSVVVHGHYHSRYRLEVDEAWGPVTVEGLDCDGSPGAFAAMDCDDGPVLRNLSVRLEVASGAGPLG
jgi:predicted phosphodiesterase